MGSCLVSVGSHYPPQQVGISVAAQQLPGTTGSVALSVELLKDNNVIAGTMGPPPLSLSANLETGFHVIRITSLAGSPRGTFQIAIAAQSFSGGVVVGGFIVPELTELGSFCLPVSQNVDIRLVGASEFSTAAEGDLVLTIKDFERTVVRTASNGIPVSLPVTPPGAPSTEGLDITWYVDASAAAGGTGSSASNGGPGISLFLAATATIENTTITGNAADGGIFLNGGSQATISGVLLRNNQRQGILAAESGTIATLTGGNQSQNTRRDGQGDGGIGLNAQTGGRINCTGSNPLSGNAGGNTLGSVTGCQ